MPWSITHSHVLKKFIYNKKLILKSNDSIWNETETYNNNIIKRSDSETYTRRTKCITHKANMVCYQWPCNFITKLKILFLDYSKRLKTSGLFMLFIIALKILLSSYLAYIAPHTRHFSELNIHCSFQRRWITREFGKMICIF